MVNQVDQALKAINAVGKSKKEFREKGIKAIHSVNQVKEAYSVSVNFVKWVREEKGVKDIYQLKRAHYREYIAFKANQGVTNGHLQNIETNLRLLSEGMKKVSEQRGMRVRDWVPKERIVHHSEREQARDRSYTREEVQKIREYLPESSKDALDLQNAFGLRLREVSNMRVAHIVERENKLYFVAVADKNTLNAAQGVTKAGRPREAPCRPEYEKRVREIIKGRTSQEYVAPRYNTLKSAYERAAKRAGIQNYTGSHGFRHSYARAELMAKLEARGIAAEGKEMLERMVANYEQGLRKDAGVSKEERELYKEVNDIVDRVHAALGHGKGRMDLVVVYMK